jgi:hypothetical protein
MGRADPLPADTLRLSGDAAAAAGDAFARSGLGSQVCSAVVVPREPRLSLEFVVLVGLVLVQEVILISRLQVKFGLRPHGSHPGA